MSNDNDDGSGAAAPQDQATRRPGGVATTRRRIVRARRPPASASGGGAGVGAGNAADGSGNTGGAAAGGPSSDLSGAIGFLQQVNGNGSGGGGNGSTNSPAARARDGGGQPPPLFLPPLPPTPPEIIPGHEEDDDDDDDDDDDEYDEYDFPGPPEFFRQFMNHMSTAARRNASRRPAQKLSAKIRPDDDAGGDDEDEEEVDHEMGSNARCAVCLRADDPDHRWRRLVTLPCCGTKGREANSSTRFCAACILQLAVTRTKSSNNGEYQLYEDEPDEYPQRKFYHESIETECKRFCECPRCRSLLLVKIKGIQEDPDIDGEEEDDEGYICDECAARGCEGGKTARSIRVHLPSFKAKFRHVGRKKGMARLLWRASLLHRNFISYEALGGDDEKATILKLAGYGVIEKVPGKRNQSVYRIKREDQAKLIRYFELPEDASDEDKKANSTLMNEITAMITYAAWRHLRDELRIDRTLRMANRFFFLILHHFGYLPPLPLHWLQELVATALIVFSSALVMQFLCVLAVYAAAFFGVGLPVCYVLRRSHGGPGSCWWQAVLVAYFAYKASVFFYESPWMKWSVLVSPKAMVPLKKMFWG